MAIHAKASGLLIGGTIINENEKHWVFQARDNKFPNKVMKGDPKNKVFADEVSIDDVLAWQEQAYKLSRVVK
ncbi:hypothetical protein KVQ01_11350 [Escherichia coli]|uniref:hypothetical protein n=1 Tax=Escherichia coli TaxID=562 RepID=UPI001F0637B5|nr:hypothetical protein [Escherichia coli]MCH0685615.1 hypothetical protein [Escherichia coli]MDZ8667115.1 hypothetical protein [Escherichia coli]WRX87697.1 hypothetical protein SM938_22480 [Escherichia coli]